MSLVFSRNSSGPSAFPWITPVVFGRVLDWFPFTFTTYIPVLMRTWANMSVANLIFIILSMVWDNWGVIEGSVICWFLLYASFANWVNDKVFHCWENVTHLKERLNGLNKSIWMSAPPIWKGLGKGRSVQRENSAVKYKSPTKTQLTSTKWQGPMYQIIRE